MPQDVASVPVGFLWAAVLFGLLAVVGGGIKVGIIHVPGMLGARERRMAGTAAVVLFLAAFCSLLIGPVTSLLLADRGAGPLSVVPQDSGAVSSGAPSSSVPPRGGPSHRARPSEARTSDAAVGSPASLTGVDPGPDGWLLPGSARDAAEAISSPSSVCGRLADRIGRERATGVEVVMFQRPTEDELFEVVDAYVGRLRAHGYEPLDARQQPIPQHWRDRARTVAGELSLGTTEATWAWCSYR
jgi:hypothetical protein